MLEQATARGACCAQIAADALDRFERRPFLGTRAAQDKSFTFNSYGEVAHMTFDVLMGLRTAGCPNRARALFCAPISPVYTVAMLGAQMCGCVLVPIHAALEPAALSHILERTCPAVVFLTLEMVASMSAACKANKLSPVFILLPSTVGSLPTYTPAPAGAPPPRPAAPVDITQLASFGARERRGRTSIADLGIQKVLLTEVCAVLYTSGSTGVPKGVVFSEELCLPRCGLLFH